MSNNTYHEHEPRLALDPRVYLLHTARARQLQSEAISRAIGAAGRFLARNGSNAYRRTTDAFRKRRTMAELSRLDDHMLADIGINREQIPMIAQGSARPERRGAAVDHPRRAVSAGVPRRRRKRYEAAVDRRLTQRQQSLHTHLRRLRALSTMATLPREGSPRSPLDSHSRSGSTTGSSTAG